MQDFISNNAKTVWNIFAKTGNINAYLLYYAIQHSNEKALIAAENYNVKSEQEYEL